jgi:hypothetical protein
MEGAASLSRREFLRLIFKAAKAIQVFFKQRPGLAVNKTSIRYFMPAVDDAQTRNEPDELLPSIDGADDDMGTVGGANDNLPPDISMPHGLWSNLTSGVGIHAPVFPPSGAEEGAVPENIREQGGTGRTGKNKRIGKLFGLDVQIGSPGLVVFLDKSDSINPLADRVRKLVNQDFPDAESVTLSGALFCNEKTWTDLAGAEKSANRC